MLKALRADTWMGTRTADEDGITQGLRGDLPRLWRFWVVWPMRERCNRVAAQRLEHSLASKIDLNLLSDESVDPKQYCGCQVVDKEHSHSP